MCVVPRRHEEVHPLHVAQAVQPRRRRQGERHRPTRRHLQGPAGRRIVERQPVQAGARHGDLESMVRPIQDDALAVQGGACGVGQRQRRRRPVAIPGDDPGGDRAFQRLATHADQGVPPRRLVLLPAVGRSLTLQARRHEVGRERSLGHLLWSEALQVGAELLRRLLGRHRLLTAPGRLLDRARAAPGRLVELLGQLRHPVAEDGGPVVHVAVARAVEVRQRRQGQLALAGAIGGAVEVPAQPDVVLVLLQVIQPGARRGGPSPAASPRRDRAGTTRADAR